MQNIKVRLSYAMLVLCFSVLYPSYALSQDGVPNLSGVWRRNKQTSPRSENPPEEMLVRIDQNNSDIIIPIRVRNKGAEETNVTHIRIGADENKNEIHGAPMTSKAAWAASVLVVDSIASFGNEKLRMNDRWTQSRDKQTLTFTERHQFGAEPEPTEVTHIFDRQADESWPVPQTSKTAEQVYPNIKVLRGVSAERLPSIMSGFGRALGVPCTRCHVEGAMERDDKPTFGKARRMLEMVNSISQNSKVEVVCWTCHRGQAIPEIGPQIRTDMWPPELEMTAEQGREPVSVVYKNIKFFNSSASDLKSSMLFMAASLGVGCSHCHRVGMWERDDKPAKDAARAMLAMVRDTRHEFTDIRIGCFTCHHGANKPETVPPADH
jgi:Photosynthetic reaction centre cytochrome C subunit